jgi:hypothetical protein
MPVSNVTELDELFAPPPATGVTTQQMQQVAALAIVKAGLAQNYAQAKLAVLEPALAQLNTVITANSIVEDVLIPQASAMKLAINGLQMVWASDATPPGPGSEMTTYTDAVQAWLENMESGSAYVPLDQWPRASLANFPNLAAALANVKL